MKLRYFYLALCSDDYLIPKPKGSEYPFDVSTIVSDFNFQSYFFTLFIEKQLQKLKYDANNFNTIMIRGRKNPRTHLIMKEHLKSLNIEIPFDEKKYKILYPYKNDYPLKNLLKPVLKEKEFNEFLFEMIMEGLTKANELKTSIPYGFLIDTILDFRSKNYVNEWIFTKKTFREYNIKVYLQCKITCNYFSLNLLIKKNKKEIYNKEILKTLPSAIHYKHEFKDLKLEKGYLIITKYFDDDTNLFNLDLAKII